MSRSQWKGSLSLSYTHTQTDKLTDVKERVQTFSRMIKRKVSVICGCERGDSKRKLGGLYSTDPFKMLSLKIRRLTASYNTKFDDRRILRLSNCGRICRVGDLVTFLPMETGSRWERKIMKKILKPRRLVQASKYASSKEPPLSSSTAKVLEMLLSFFLFVF